MQLRPIDFNGPPTFAVGRPVLFWGMSFLESWILLGLAAGVFQALRVAGQALAQRTDAQVQLSAWSAALAQCLFELP